MQNNQTEPASSTYFHRKALQLGLPIAGNFELTARCNFRCPMCYVHLDSEQIRQRGQELTAQQWMTIARDARDRGMLFVLLTGGEPLVRKDFFEIYRGMKELGLLISINTNGSLLSGEILERFLEDPPVRFNISLYGGSNETYRDFCGQPAYDQVRENIRRLREAGVEVSLNVSVTPRNQADLPKIYQDAVDLDVNVKMASYMYPPIRIDPQQCGGGYRMTPQEAAKLRMQWDALRLTPQELTQRKENIRALVQQQQDCPVEGEDGVFCRAGRTAFWITWDGRMLPCGMMPGPEAYPLATGFDQAWEQIRRGTAEIRLPEDCKNCDKRPICSVCAAVCVTETGGFAQPPQYMCQMTQHLLELASEETI